MKSTAKSGHHHIVKEPMPLMDFLRATFPQTGRNTIKGWLRNKSIKVNGVSVSQFNHPLEAGDRIALTRDRFEIGGKALPGGLKILHEDEAILIIDKPAGLLTIATESEKRNTAYFKLNELLQSRPGKKPERVFIVHRLDRDTSGLLLFAKSEEIQERLQDNWEDVHKEYRAVVVGTPTPATGEMRDHLQEIGDFKVHVTRPGPESKLAITKYRVIRSGLGKSLVALELVTGRKHQIRAQLGTRGWPVIGDDRYGCKEDPIKRLALHAAALKFKHPYTGQNLEFNSPLPGAFAPLLEKKPKVPQEEIKQPGSPQKQPRA